MIISFLQTAGPLASDSDPLVSSRLRLSVQAVNMQAGSTPIPAALRQTLVRKTFWRVLKFRKVQNELEKNEVGFISGRKHPDSPGGPASC